VFPHAAYLICLEKIPLERHRLRQKDNIKMDFEVGCECMDWINLAHDRV
jgi:hypothetical protein